MARSASSACVAGQRRTTTSPHTHAHTLCAPHLVLECRLHGPRLHFGRLGGRALALALVHVGGGHLNEVAHAVCLGSRACPAPPSAPQAVARCACRARRVSPPHRTSSTAPDTAGSPLVSAVALARQHDPGAPSAGTPTRACRTASRPPSSPQCQTWHHPRRGGTRAQRGHPCSDPPAHPTSQARGGTHVGPTDLNKLGGRNGSLKLGTALPT